MHWFRRSRETQALRLQPPNGFGDHLMLSAVIEGIRTEHPALPIEVAADHPEIFQHNPHVRRVLYRGRLKKWARGYLEQFKAVHFRSPEERYLQVEGHLIEDMYRCVGLPLREHPRQPRIYLTQREWEFGSELDRLPRPLVAVVPNGKPRIRLPNKLYPADQWSALAPLLAALPATLVQIGSRQDGPLLEGAQDYRDLGYRKTAAVLKRCDLLVTHVSGLMHLAAAIRLPSVVLYGAAEHPAISGYPRNRNLYIPIECGPCWMETPCSHHSCMRQLTPETVLEAVREALASAPEIG